MQKLVRWSVVRYLHITVHGSACEDPPLGFCHYTSQAHIMHALMHEKVFLLESSSHLSGTGSVPGLLSNSPGADMHHGNVCTAL